MTVIITGTTSVSTQISTPHQVIRAMDLGCLILIALWVSHAWYYPSYITTDAVPGVVMSNLSFQLACLYGTVRLLARRPTDSIILEPLFLLILLFGISSIATTSSLSNTLGMVRTSVLFFCATLFIRQRYSRHFVISIILDLMGALLILSAIAALMLPFGVMQGYDSGRWKGVFGHKNSLGEYAAFTFLVVFAVWRARSGFKRRHVAYGFVALLCVGLAGSATAFGVMAIGLFVLELNRWFAISKLNRSLALLLYLTMILAATLAAYQSIGFAAEYLGRDLTFTGRTGIWEQFMAFGLQRPWTGWGWATIGTSEYMLPIIRQTLGLPNIQTPHNGYLSVIVELGFPALLAYITWLASTFFSATWTAIVKRDAISALRAALVVALSLQNFFESTAGITPSLWILLLIATGNRRSIRWN